MDCGALLEVLMMLFTLLLQTAHGFSIRANNQNHRRGWWPSDVDTTTNIKDRMQFDNSPPQERKSIKSHRQNFLHQPVFNPEESFLYSTFASLNGKDDSLKRTLTSFSTGNDDNGYNKNILDNSDGDAQNRDDEIDVIATISYPQNGMPALDNLSLSTKIGRLAVPSKRQQGWYVQYGKRTASRDVSKEGEDDSNLISYDEMKTQPEISKIPFSTQSGDEDIVKPSKFGLDLEWSRKLQQLENDLKLRSMAYDIIKSIIKEKSKNSLQQLSSVKRQQGWFTQYGKRSSEGIQHSFS